MKRKKHLGSCQLCVIPHFGARLSNSAHTHTLRMDSCCRRCSTNLGTAPSSLPICGYFVFFLRQVCSAPGWTSTCYVAQGGLELVLCRPQPPCGWNYKHVHHSQLSAALSLPALMSLLMTLHAFLCRAAALSGTFLHMPHAHRSVVCPP